MALPLDSRSGFGLQTRLMDAQETQRLVLRLEELGFNSIWVGDHLSFAVPILDPLLQLAQAAAFSTKLLVGTGVYLLPLRHPGPVAKQVASLDVLSKGRVIFGVGVAGEFESDFRAAGVPINERGPRLAESIVALRKLWSGETVSHDGKFFPFRDVKMLPPPVQKGGPPIWFGGRAEVVLKRCARIGDGYLSYVVTPEQYAKSLATIESHVGDRQLDRFATAHLLFAQVGDSYEEAFKSANEQLSLRYAMDFTKATQRYAAVGRPEDVAAKIREFHAAGVRQFNLDFLHVPIPKRNEQFERFATEVFPLVKDLL